MKEINVVVNNETGLHSRPADLFVRTAKLHTSQINVSKEDKSADAKNIIKVILLNVSQGEEVSITADGPDEEEAVEQLRRLIESNFKEINEAVEI